MYLKISKIICFILLLNVVRSQFYVANTQKYCKFFNIDDWQISQEERQQKRDSSSYLVVGNFGKVMDFLIQKNEINLIVGLITYSIVIVVLTLIAFVGVCFFLIFPWLCMEVQNKQRKRIKILWWTMLCCGFGFVASYTTFLVSSQKIKNSINSINCAVSMMPQQIITGTKLSAYEYMGWNGIIDLLENFQIDLKSLGNHSDSYDQILNIGLQQKGVDAIDSVINYQSNYQDTVIPDGVGEQSQPLTIQLLTNTTDAIKEEFENFTKVANQTQAGAQIGKTMSLQENVDNFATKTAEAISYLKVLKQETQDPLNEISDSTDQLSQYLSSIHVLVLLLGIVLIILLIFFYTVLYYNCERRQCFKLFVPMKFFLLLSGIFTLIFGAVAIFTLIVSGSISSTCKQVSAVLVSDEPDQVLISAGVELTENQKLFVKQCIPESKTGLFDSVLTGFTDIQTLLEGETIFQNFRVNLTRSSEDSDSIKSTAKVWDYYLTGYYSNFKNVNETIANLNKQIACEEQEIRLNMLNCTASGFSCQEVENVATPYTPPSCVDSREDSQLYFNNLVNYFSENSKLIKEMVDNLQSEKSSTPNTKYKELRQSLFEADGLRSGIRQTLLQTLNDASKFNTGFESFSNCKAARNQVLNLEYGLCFASNSNASYYLFSTMAMLLFMIVINTSLYFAMKNVEIIDFYKLDNSNVSEDSDNDKEV